MKFVTGVLWPFSILISVKIDIFIQFRSAIYSCIMLVVEMVDVLCCYCGLTFPWEDCPSNCVPVDSNLEANRAFPAICDKCYKINYIYVRCKIGKIEVPAHPPILPVPVWVPVPTVPGFINGLR